MSLWIFLVIVLCVGIMVLLAAGTKQAHAELKEADSNLPPPILIRPVERAPLTITPRFALEEVKTIIPTQKSIPLIKPAFHPLWEERGWVRSEADGEVVYTGAFMVLDEKAAVLRYFPGKLMEAEQEIKVRVQDIPKELYASTGKHPKRFCFRPIDTTKSPIWYALHFNQPPKDAGSAILYLERILFEGVNRKW